MCKALVSNRLLAVEFGGSLKLYTHFPQYWEEAGGLSASLIPACSTISYYIFHFKVEEADSARPRVTEQRESVSGLH